MSNSETISVKIGRILVNSKLQKIIETYQCSPYGKAILRNEDVDYLIKMLAQSRDTIRAIAPWIAASFEGEVCSEYAEAANNLLELERELSGEEELPMLIVDVFDVELSEQLELDFSNEEDGTDFH